MELTCFDCVDFVSEDAYTIPVCVGEFVVGITIEGSVNEPPEEVVLELWKEFLGPGLFFEQGRTHQNSGSLSQTYDIEVRDHLRLQALLYLSLWLASSGE